MHNSSISLALLQTEGNYYFRLVNDRLPINRAEVQLLGEKGTPLGPCFVFELVDPTPTPNVRLQSKRKTLATADTKAMAGIKVQFCQFVLAHLAECNSMYYDWVKAFHVQFEGKNLVGIGSIEWPSGEIPMRAVAVTTHPKLELVS